MIATDVNMVRGCSPAGSLASDPMLSTETSPASDSSDRDLRGDARAQTQVSARPRCCLASARSDDISYGTGPCMRDACIVSADVWAQLRPAVVPRSRDILIWSDRPHRHPSAVTAAVPNRTVRFDTTQLHLIRWLRRITAPRAGSAAGTGLRAQHAATTPATATPCCSRRVLLRSARSRRRQPRSPRCAATCKAGRRSCTGCSQSASWTAISSITLSSFSSRPSGCARRWCALLSTVLLACQSAFVIAFLTADPR